MGADIRTEIDVAVSPEVAWAIVGDPCGVTTWYPLYTACRVDGITRTLERADGVVITEDLLSRDDVAMTYSYAVTSGLPLAEHEASFTVSPHAHGCTVVWCTHAVHDDPSIDMEERLAGRQADALAGLRAILEGNS